MTTPIQMLGLLLVSSALVAPAALAQSQPPTSTLSPGAPPASVQDEAEAIESATPGADPEIENDDDAFVMPDISGPGGGDEDDMIIVQGRNIPEPIRATAEVVSVLTAEDIQRAGDGNIASALQRVTGLSLVGGRFVYVRGLGERYSLALLNGSPLPSPEPLRRVVPLDIFPTSIIASSVVQKSYSAAYPGEFGGGVINLTTSAIPEENFITIGGSISGNTETTGELGYTYFGSDTDFTGFDDGSRDIPGIFQEALDSGNLIEPGADFTLEDVQNITASLLNASTTLIQRNDNIPVNGSIEISAGRTIDIGSDRLGIIANFGWKNSW
ncbi:MAG: TonB-dependent receptor plug domain-containing protein [Pseudomonadota bacterium]